MPLSDAQRAQLATHLLGDPRYAGGEPDGLAPTHVLLSLLCAVPRVPNPAPAPQIPKPMSALEMLGLLSAASLGRLETAGLVAEINTAIGLGERQWVSNWTTYAVAREHISAEEYAGIQGLLAATIDDPDHPTEVDGGPAPLQELFGYEVGVSRQDVNAALGRVDE